MITENIKTQGKSISDKQEKKLLAKKFEKECVKYKNQTGFKCGSLEWHRMNFVGLPIWRFCFRQRQIIWMNFQCARATLYWLEDFHLDRETFVSIDD